MRSRLSGGACLIFSPDLRVSVRWDRLITYPDVTVICGAPKYTDDKRDTITNLTILVEVLSPSTAHFDRGHKSFLYRKIDSLQEFLLLEPDEMRVEHYPRLATERWEITGYSDRDAVVRLGSAGCELALTATYLGTDQLG